MIPILVWNRREEPANLIVATVDFIVAIFQQGEGSDLSFLEKPLILNVELLQLPSCIYPYSLL